jgi:RimJ/RimL family protein N-acetyltransferase
MRVADGGRLVIVLETERTILRTWEPDDLDALAAIYADPDVMRYIGMGEPVTREAAADFLTWADEYIATNGFGPWATCDRSGRLIGRCGFIRRDDQPPDELEMMYLFARDSWGAGLATEVATGLLAYARTAFPSVERIVIVVSPGNDASVRVAEKLGSQALGLKTLDDGRDVLSFALRLRP